MLQKQMALQKDMELDLLQNTMREPGKKTKTLTYNQFYLLFGAIKKLLNSMQFPYAMEILGSKTDNILSFIIVLENWIVSVRQLLL